MAETSATQDRRIAWRKNKRALGLCINCGRHPIEQGRKSLCKDCGIAARLSARLSTGSKSWKAGKQGRPPL